ncbi:nucleoside triphosphate pyrophosphohydrolase [Agreia sp. VKM Ac-1783]|uniref:nucleoside triphosphate pyrophosphohydrolase n=1 Tax=Agreia sp. VKM Ac-1783 TaxID=1938889 RepID=UPI000A2AACA4|nr:nucleoside triphosphate pyrophosphohydrolase [Agreia sp. VKM Ac-1783]SMQ61964.1 Predicted house-cleaning noncanonical NTP pyrophosphatase, all-alpha NTP-PPase (MazG) superfamily [Agreia sp. VKM Ac-1783]
MGKLIRDRVPDIVREGGHHIAVRELAADEYAAALRAKLLEEAREAHDAAGRAALLEELADLAEVALALAQHEGITEAEILNQRAAKNRSHGTFDGRLFSTSYRS